MNEATIPEGTGLPTEAEVAAAGGRVTMVQRTVGLPPTVSRDVMEKIGADLRAAGIGWSYERSPSGAAEIISRSGPLTAEAEQEYRKVMAIVEANGVTDALDVTELRD